MDQLEDQASVMSNYSHQSAYSSYSSRRLPPPAEPFDDDDNDDIEQASTSLFDDPSVASSSVASSSMVAAAAARQEEAAMEESSSSRRRRRGEEIDGVMISSQRPPPAAAPPPSAVTESSSTTTRRRRQQQQRNSSSQQDDDDEQSSAFHRFFQLKERNTTIRQEFRAATVSFLSLSYVLVTNKTILAGVGGGMLKSDAIVFATALSSAVACFLVGTLANVPFGMVPHLGLSSFLVHGLVLAELLTVQEALTASWLAGILTLGVGLLPGVFPLLIRLSPSSFRLGTAAGIGLMVTLNALVSVGIIVSHPKTIVALGDDVWTDWTLILCMVGIGTMASLLYHGWTTSFWVGMSVMALIYWEGMSEWPARSFMGLPPEYNLFVDLELLVTTPTAGRFYLATVTFVIIILYDITGVGLGLASETSMITNASTMIPSGTATTAAGRNNNNNSDDTPIITKRTSLRWILLASSVGTMVGSWAGSSPITLATESVTGIHQQGGRSGLSAVFMGFYFLLSIFFSPLLSSFPAIASVAVLVLAMGTKLMSETSHVDWNKIQDALPAFVTMIMIPFTCNISTGLLLGYISFLFLYITSGKIFIEVHDFIQTMIKQHQRQRIPNRETTTTTTTTNTNHRRNHHHTTTTTTSLSSTRATIDEHSTTTTSSLQQRQRFGTTSTFRYEKSGTSLTATNDDSSSLWSSSLPSSLRRVESDGLVEQSVVDRQKRQRTTTTTCRHRQQQEEENEHSAIEASDTLSLPSSSSSSSFGHDEIFEDDNEELQSTRSQYSAEAHVSPV